MDALISQLDVTEYINTGLIVFLMAIGFLIKHRNVAKESKVINNAIPIVLLILAFGYNALTLDDVSKAGILNAIVDAITSAAIAIGLHNGGKNTFKIISQLGVDPDDEDDFDDDEDYESDEDLGLNDVEEEDLNE